MPACLAACCLLPVQVYAPVDDNPAAFHRTVSLFVSPDGDKLAQAGTGGAGRQAAGTTLRLFLFPACCAALRCCLPSTHLLLPLLPSALNPPAVRALRCQLPRANKFYPPDPPKKTDVRPPQLPGQRRSAPVRRQAVGYCRTY